MPLKFLLFKCCHVNSTPALAAFWQILMTGRYESVALFQGYVQNRVWQAVCHPDQKQAHGDNNREPKGQKALVKAGEDGLMRKDHRRA
mgnify:CR=1 FL=1